MNTHRRWILAVTAMVAMLLVGEAALRLLLRSGPVWTRLDEAEQRLAGRWFGAERWADTVCLVGTSLAGELANPLVAVLGSSGAHAQGGVVQASAPGLYGDQIARMLNLCGPQDEVLFELNVFTLNEREALFANWSGSLIVKDWSSARRLWELPGFALRRALLRQGGIEDALAGSLRTLSAGYFLGHATKGGLRSRMRVAILGKERGRVAPDAQLRDAITARNWARKSFEEGDDITVLDALQRWLAMHPERAAKTTLYFPPLNGAYIRRVASNGAEGWARFVAFRMRWTVEFQKAGARVLDLTDLIREESGFKDYGHLQEGQETAVATAMAESLRVSTGGGVVSSGE